MKNRILVWAAVFIVLFSACRKAEISEPDRYLSLPESHTRLVPDKVAEEVATKFNPAIYLRQPGAKPSQKINLIKDRTVIADHSNTPALYVYNFEDKGYLVVSADSSLRPVMAYVEKGRFDIDDFKKGKAPGGAVRWLNKTLINIEAVRKGLYDNNRNGTLAWRDYFVNLQKPVAENANRQANNIKPIEDPCASDPDYYTVGGNRVGPLLTTTWAQGDTYNDFLAYAGCTNSFNGSPPTGCVATAMAQVLRYWQYPTGYNYSNMPDQMGNSDVRQLMAAAGASVSMQYSCSGSAPSSFEVWFFNSLIIGSPTTDLIASVFTNTFGYSSATSAFYNRVTDAEGMVANIITGKPVILCGYPDHNSIFGYPQGSGHCWVCDGYNEAIFTYCYNGNSVSSSSLDLHMNWGWDEVAYSPYSWNGWYAFDNWYIPNAYRDYQYYNEAAANIHP